MKEETCDLNKKNRFNFEKSSKNDF